MGKPSVEGRHPRKYLRSEKISNESERALGDMPPPPSASSAADAGKPRAACCASARFCSPASSSRPERSRSSHADSHRRRQSHHQQTAGNYELVRDEDAESWRRSGSCPNKMGLAAAEKPDRRPGLGSRLGPRLSAALREGKFCHALVSSRFLVAVARAVSSGDQYNPLEHRVGHPRAMQRPLLG